MWLLAVIIIAAALGIGFLSLSLLGLVVKLTAK
jgi:hypothetical protein